jgi:hypothetical protein
MPNSESPPTGIEEAVHRLRLHHIGWVYLLAVGLVLAVSIVVVRLVERDWLSAVVMAGVGCAEAYVLSLVLRVRRPVPRATSH